MNKTQKFKLHKLFTYEFSYAQLLLTLLISTLLGFIIRFLYYSTFRQNISYVNFNLQTLNYFSVSISGFLQLKRIILTSLLGELYYTILIICYILILVLLIKIATKKYFVRQVSKIVILSFVPILIFGTIPFLNFVSTIFVIYLLFISFKDIGFLSWQSLGLILAGYILAKICLYIVDYGLITLLGV